MSTAQKIIKMLAIAFAIFLIVLIFSILVRVGMAVTRSIVPTKEKPIVSQKLKIDDISNIDISLEYASLNIKNGNKLLVKNNDTENIKIVNEDGILKIIEKKKKIFKNEKRTVILYIPEDMKFTAVNIETGVGMVNIDNIDTDGLNLNLGVGKTNINNIVANFADIETGAGDVSIKNGILNNSTIEVGIGKLDINGKFTGTNKIESGIGELKLTLDNSNDYKIKFSKGLGSINYNGNTISNDTTIGTGNNYISIDGGIGSIDVVTNNR